MAAPKNIVEPDFLHTHPSERRYLDTSKSTVDGLVIIDEAKSGADYGIKDAEEVKPIVTETAGNGG